MASRRKHRRGSPGLQKRFRIALLHAGLTQRDWARQEGPEPNGWSDTHVDEVARGTRRSAEALAKIVGFTRAMEAEMRRLPPIETEIVTHDETVPKPNAAAA